ncbi:exlX [Mytilus coruscus]|uniref:ExlX n=1 Tax=Mytilus coruscus TaxID=42192 RepID=A0A6J8F0U4_MYTCO|nr:exlX [Mytilus coruscus]
MSIIMDLKIITFMYVISLTSGATHQGILNLYHNKFKGDGTYYGAGEQGTCSYSPPSLPPTVAAGNIKRYIALNKPQFFNSLSCGMCFKVHGSGKGLGSDPIVGDSIVFVKDLCPECLAGSVDLAENGDGRWEVEIQAVQCPVGNTKLEYKFQGSNPWYLKLQVRNARIPVTRLSLWQPKSQRWAAMQHTSDGFWLMGPGPFEKPVHPSVHAPLKMKLTAANGVVIEDQITKMPNEVVIHGTGKQFPQDPSLPQA